MKAYGMSDCGTVREENQDYFLFDCREDAETLTAVLCDGMGGAQAGSVASKMAGKAFMFHAAGSIDKSSSSSDMRHILTDAVTYANIKVYDKSYSDFTCMGMGSTLVGALMTAKRAFVANVGDSRAYLIADGRIQQITKDHSFVAELVRKGELTPDEARTHPRKNIITRAIGVEASVKCDIFEIKAPPDSRILLCSDGLSNVLTDNEIAGIVLRYPDLQDACGRLMDMALNRGAPDNVTVLIISR